MHCGGHVSVITCGGAATAPAAKTAAAALQESAEWRRGGGASSGLGLGRHGRRRRVRLQQGRQGRRLLLLLRLKRLLDRREAGGGRNGRCCWLLGAGGREPRRCCPKWLRFALRSGVVRCCGLGGGGRGVVVVRRLECPCFRGCVCDGCRGLGRGGADLQRGLSGLGLLLLRLLPRRRRWQRGDRGSLGLGIGRLLLVQGRCWDRWGGLRLQGGRRSRTHACHFRGCRRRSRRHRSRLGRLRGHGSGRGGRGDGGGDRRHGHHGLGGVLLRTHLGRGAVLAGVRGSNVGLLGLASGSRCPVKVTGRHK